MSSAHHLKRIIAGALLSGSGIRLGCGGFRANRGHFVYDGPNPPPNLGCIPGLCLPGL